MPSKAASIHLSRTLANQLAEKYICVNVICPGPFPSLMTGPVLSKNREIFDNDQPTGESNLISASSSFLALHRMKEWFRAPTDISFRSASINVLFFEL